VNFLAWLSGSWKAGTWADGSWLTEEVPTEEVSPGGRRRSYYVRHPSSKEAVIQAEDEMILACIMAAVTKGIIT
jgi:hypothetical protein